MYKSRIIKQEDNFSQWYDSIIEHAKLAQPSSIKGFFYLLPNAWAIWEQIQKYFNEQFQNLNISNVAFPTLINMQDLAKEAEHLEGFAPELFQVKHKNNAEYGLRPTSEIHFCHYFKANLTTYNQLPLKVNQWVNVFRAEKNTKAFLRSSEFFWHELHTIHANAFEAHQSALSMFELYQKFFSQVLNIAFLAGSKTINERFAGANNTWTVETLMPDGQMLQSCTSHDLGTNFSKAFDIKVTDSNNQKQYCHQSSAGLSTRVIGAIIMVHGDNYGLVLPFQLAKHQIALLTLLDNNDPEANQYLERIQNHLQPYRYLIDSSDKSFGYKIQNQEINGTPFSVVVGKKEFQNQQVMIYNRLTREKNFINIDDVSTHLQQATVEYQQQMLHKSQQHLVNNIVECHAWEQVVDVVNNQKKIALAPWFDDAENEANLKKEGHGFGTRCIKQTLDSDTNQTCVFSQKPANCLVYFARSY